MVTIFKINIPELTQADEAGRAIAELWPDTTISIEPGGDHVLLIWKHPEPDAGAVLSLLVNRGYEAEILPVAGRNNGAIQMKEFWESGFQQHNTMWGFEPAQAALLAKDLFIEEGVKDVLLPGIGYGRNAAIFIREGIKVTGIEIAPSAIARAKSYLGPGTIIYEGSVTDMPFDDHRYEGIFCHGLLYLLDVEQRKKMIRDCYAQLRPGGWMVCSILSKNSPNYGLGRLLAKDTFAVGDGGQLFFYDKQSLRKEFEVYGLQYFTEISEQINAKTGQPAFRFFLVVCRKGEGAKPYEDAGRSTADGNS